MSALGTSSPTIEQDLWPRICVWLPATANFVPIGEGQSLFQDTWHGEETLIFPDQLLAALADIGQLFEPDLPDGGAVKSPRSSGAFLQ